MSPIVPMPALMTDEGGAHGHSRRVRPGTLRESGVPAYVFARVAARVMGTRQPPQIFTVFSRNRGLFWGWLHFAARMMPFGSLSRREAELIILTAAQQAGSSYEWDHHSHIGRKAGLTEDQIHAIATGAAVPGLSSREDAICVAARELVGTGDISDGSWTTLRMFTSEEEALDVVFTAAHYRMLATIIDTLRLQPDPR